MKSAGKRRRFRVTASVLEGWRWTVRPVRGARELGSAWRLFGLRQPGLPHV